MAEVKPFVELRAISLVACWEHPHSRLLQSRTSPFPKSCPNLPHLCELKRAPHDPIVSAGSDAYKDRSKVDQPSEW